MLNTKRLFTLLIISLLVTPSQAQESIITVIAGNRDITEIGDGGLAVNAHVEFPRGIMVDSTGNVYIADTENHRVRKIDANGIITTIVGTGEPGFPTSGGLATVSPITLPYNLIMDDEENLYIADNGSIYKVDQNGIITVIAGMDDRGFSGDGGLAVEAKLYEPYGMAFDEEGNLYFSDSFNSRIRRIDTNGIITTIAGSNIPIPTGDGGPAIDAGLSTPLDILFDHSGNLLIASTFNIRQISTDGIINTIMGGIPGNSGDGGPASEARFVQPWGMTYDSSGNLYIADRDNNNIRKVDTNGIVSTVAGNGMAGYSGDGGQAVNASLNTPYNVTVDQEGSLYIADTKNKRIRKVNPNGVIETIAGSSNFGENGIATALSLYAPNDVVVDENNNLLLVETNNHRIRRIDTNGFISTIAGNGASGFSGDGGLAIDATFTFPKNIALRNDGSIFIADTDNQRIRKIDPNGIITTVAGNGQSGYAGDGGLAINASLNKPNDIIFDSNGNLIFSDLQNHCIRKIDANGIITTIAGTGVNGYSGDGGAAVLAELKNPDGIAIDGAGNLFIADTSNNRIRKITPNGIISTVAGNDSRNTSGDGGLAADASFNAPRTLLFDDAGNLLVGEIHHVRKIDTNGMITTISGGGRTRVTNIPATNAFIGTVAGMAFDTNKNLLIANGNDEVYKVTFSPSAVSNYQLYQ